MSRFRKGTADLDSGVSSYKMANENNKLVKKYADIGDQTQVVDPLPDRQEANDSPEDVVRKLLKAENHGKSPAQPLLQTSAPPDSTPDEKPAGQSFPGRLTKAPLHAVAKVWARARIAVLSYRPTPRHMALALLAVIVLTMPWLIPILFLLLLIMIVISYLTLGHDRSAELVAGRYGAYASRDPQAAELLRARAESFSARISTWIEFLPDRWTTGLYLPDFSHSDEVPEKLSDDPFERLAGDPQNR